jgi:TM2 domain-containing membrane protein YozV
VVLRGSGASYGIDPKTGLPFSHRSKVVAGVLQICLGGLGIGRFYTGHVGIAIAQIAVTFFTCGLGAIWPLIDDILMLVGDSPRDVDGRPLRPG